MTVLATLENLEHARLLLAASKSLQDVAEVRDKAAALAHYAKARADGSDAHADAWELVQLATRRLGELTRELPKAAAGRKPNLSAGEQISSPKPKHEAIAELGMTRPQVARAEKLAELDETEFRARLELGRQRITKAAEPDSMLAVTAAAGHDGDMFSTPAKYVEPGRKVMGSIELDPASNESAQRIVQAERYYTAERSGLDVEWIARSLWLNPPYSRGLIGRFIAKLLVSIQAGQVEQAIVLVNCDPSTSWYQSLLRPCAGCCLLDHRIAFELDGQPVRGNAHPQTFFYFGPKLPAFARAYAEFGSIVTTYKTSRRTA